MIEFSVDNLGEIVFALALFALCACSPQPAGDILRFTLSHHDDRMSG